MTPTRALGVAAVGMFVTCAPAAQTAQAAQAVPAAQVAPVAARSCQETALPTPAGTTESSVNGSDPTGRLLVGVGFHVGGAEGLLWVGGRLTPVDQKALAPSIQVQFNAVDSRGVIVGERLTNESSFHTDAFVYRHGRFTRLRAPVPGEATEALAVDASGDVVGNADGPSGWQPVEWPADRPGTVRVLPTPGGGSGFATGVDTDGTVVGYLGSQPTATPYVWPAHGAGHALALPADVSNGDAVAISQGWVAGDVLDTATGTTVPALWNLHTGRFTMYRNVAGAALSVNRWGTIGVAGGAIVYADGRVIPVSGWVNALDDRGGAAGASAEFTGHAVVWRGCWSRGRR